MFIKRYKPQFDDIIVSRVGSFGNFSLVPNEEVCLGQNVALIHPSIDNKFLYYFLNSQYVTDYLSKNAKGGSYKNIGIKDILQIPIKVPDLARQKYTSAILERFDINTESALLAPQRVSEIVAYILDHFDQKTKRNNGFYSFSKLTNIAEVAKNQQTAEEKSKVKLNGFNSIFAVSSIDAAKAYYVEFKRQMAEHPEKALNIATIYSYGQNEEDPDGFLDDEDSDSTDELDVTSREFLENAISDYNKTFKVDYDTSSEKFPNYYKDLKGLMTLHNGSIFKRVREAFEDAGYTLNFKLLNAANFGVPQKRERVILVGIRNDLGKTFVFPDEPNSGNWVPLSVAVPQLAIDEKKYYFSERAVQGMKNAKNNMKRGLAQNLDEPSLTVTSHLAKVSLNSRDPVLLVDPEKELYRRFTPREAARIQSFPDSFQFAGSETDAYRQIGNAVPPVLFWHISKKLAEILSE